MADSRFIGTISPSELSLLSSVAMFAGMLGAMLYRRSEYTMDHAAMTHGVMQMPTSTAARTDHGRDAAMDHSTMTGRRLTEHDTK